MRQEMFLVGWPHPKGLQGGMVRMLLRWLHQKWPKARVVRIRLRWPHLKWPRDLMVRASGESGLPHSDEVSGTHHSDLSTCPNPEGWSQRQKLEDESWAWVVTHQSRTCALTAESPSADMKETKLISGHTSCPCLLWGPMGSWDLTTWFFYLQTNKTQKMSSIVSLAQQKRWSLKFMLVHYPLDIPHKNPLHLNMSHGQEFVDPRMTDIFWFQKHNPIFYNAWYGEECPWGKYFRDSKSLVHGLMCHFQLTALCITGTSTR